MTAMPVGATVLYYDVVTNPGWLAPNAWGEAPPQYDTTWSAGSSAVFSQTASSTTVVLTASTNVANLTLHNTVLRSADTVNLTINGGDLTVIGTAASIGDGLTLQGSYTFKGGTLLVGNNPARWTDYVGTATIESGTIHFFRPELSFGANSNFVVAGGTLHAGNRSVNATMGTLTINSGTFQMGRSTTHVESYTFTVARLSGTGGTLMSIGGDGAVNTFVVDQSADTSYAGSILGAQNSARTALQKAGTGDLTLTGQIDLRRTTTVSGGRLYINGTNTAFSDEVGSTAISVAGGTLGGTGTIEIADNSNVVLGGNGQLSAGLVGSAGRTTYALGTGTLNLSAATASTNTGWLHFTLGGLTTPGSTYSQILLTSGTLDIGTGLNFDDFSFTADGGFGPGQYVLFDTPGAITGTLGMFTTGTIGIYDATLSFLGNNQLVLDVIPEPGSFALLLAGAALIAAARRRRA